MVRHMNRSAGKRENRHFGKVRSDFQLPPGIICYGDKPDVILRGVKTIGIEITNFFFEPGHAVRSEQRQRPRRNEFITSAQRAFEMQTGKNIGLTFGFDKAQPIKDASALASRLATLAKTLSSRETGEIPRALLMASLNFLSHTSMQTHTMSLNAPSARTPIFGWLQLSVRHNPPTM